MFDGRIAYVFPGQGVQGVGMGLDLYEAFASARALFQEADSTLVFPLSRLCFQGPEEALRQTINAQPAILLVSLACLRAAQETDAPSLGAGPAFVAGHSLGEYTALVAAGALDFPHALRLVRERGRLMQEAGEKHPGGMAAIMGLDEEAVRQVCIETDTEVANRNSSGQMVISGTLEALNQAMELARTLGARHVTQLNVSAAFHSRLMRPASEAMARLVEEVPFRDPQVPVVANATAKPLAKAAEVRSELVRQLCSTVEWQRSIEFMISQGVSTFVEIGPGRVLSGLIKRINGGVEVLNLSDTHSLAPAG